MRSEHELHHHHHHHHYRRRRRRHYLVHQVRKSKRRERHKKERESKRGVGVLVCGMEDECGEELKPVEEAVDEYGGAYAGQPGDVLG